MAKIKAKTTGAAYGSFGYSFFILWSVSLLALLVLNVANLFRIIPEMFHLRTDESNANFISIGHAISTYINKLPHVNAVGIFIFWALVGSIAYVLVMLLGSLLFAARNDVNLVKNYKLPLFVKRSNVLERIAFQWLLIVCLCVICVSVLLLLFLVILPVCENIFLAGFTHPKLLSAWAKTIASTLSLAVVLWSFMFLLGAIKRTFKRI